MFPNNLLFYYSTRSTQQYVVKLIYPSLRAAQKESLLWGIDERHVERICVPSAPNADVLVERFSACRLASADFRFWDEAA